jgi:hypothetical protein
MYMVIEVWACSSVGVQGYNLLTTVSDR